MEPGRLRGEGGGGARDRRHPPALALLCPPVAVAVAVLRYRLDDLDRVVSRTLTYALLTVLLGLGCAAVVLGLGRLLPEGYTRGRRRPAPDLLPGAHAAGPRR